MALPKLLAEHYADLTAQQLVFGFLSRVFYAPPDPTFIDNLASQDLFAEWPIPAVNADTQEGLSLLRAFCPRWRIDQIGELRQDYNRLFVGPDRLLAPPWESVYRSSEHLTFEKETLEVRKTYAAFGLQAPHPNVEPDDHIGLELAFVVHLCHLGAKALESGQSDVYKSAMAARRAFLDQHLRRWAPECMQRVIRFANTDYYRGAAYLLLGSLIESEST